MGVAVPYGAILGSIHHQGLKPVWPQGLLRISSQGSQVKHYPLMTSSLYQRIVAVVGFFSFRLFLFCFCTPDNTVDTIGTPGQWTEVLIGRKSPTGPDHRDNWGNDHPL